MFRHFLNVATAQPAGDRTKSEAAMDLTYKQRPTDYFKAARDSKLQLSGSLTDLSEEQLDKLDAILEQLEAQPREALN